MGLRILNVAWMQNECLLSIASENWTHIFKSRKSEKPCMDYWAKKFGKNAPKHVQNTFGHFRDRFWAFLEFWIFFWFFWKFWKARPSMEHGALFVSKKLPKNMFKTSLDNFGNDLQHFCNFAFFFIFSKTSDDSMNTEQKNVSKKMPQDSFGH